MDGRIVVTIGALAAMLSLGGSAVAATPSAPEVREATLSNGLRVLLIPQHHLPMVVATVLVDAGSRLDPTGKEGVANLVAQLLTEGTASRTSAEVHDQIDFLGARLSTNAGDDYASASLTVLLKNLEPGFELLADVLLHPTFPDDEVARKRAEALASLEAEDQDPGSVAGRAFRKALHGEGPYRAPTLGRKESVAKLDRGELVGFYGSTYWPSRARIVVAGDVTLENLLEPLEKAFGGWQDGEGEGLTVGPSEPGKAEVVRIDRELAQANVVWGHTGPPRDDPDWYALQVMNHILGGGGFSSRLMQSIRTEAGLAYSVYSYFSGKKLPSSFQVVLQTKNESTDDALSRLRREIERIRSEEVSEEEIDEAKRYLTGSFPLRIDSNADLVGFFSQVDFYGIGLDYPDRYEGLINDVSREDVLRVAKAYLHPGKAILVIVGDQEQIPELDVAAR